MATYEITSPTGETFEITAPDNATEAEVMAYAEEQFSPAQGLNEMAPGSSTMQGARDIPNALGQMAEQALPESVSGAINTADQWLYDKTGGFLGNPYESFDAGVRAQEADYQQSRAEAGETGFDWPRMGGNVLATAPAGGPAMTGATLPARLAMGGATGGLLGPAATPVTEGDDFWDQKMDQGLLGVAGGAVGTGVGAGIGRLFSPQTDDAARLLLNEDVRVTPGGIMGPGAKSVEDKAVSIPVVGDAIRGAQVRSVDDLNRAAYGRALTPIGVQVDRQFPTGAEGVWRVSDELSRAYSDIIPQGRFRSDPTFVQELDYLRQMSRSLAPDQQRRFNQILDEEVLAKMTPQGNASGESLKAIESLLGNHARGYGKDGLYDNQQLGRALQELQASIRRGAQRSSPPGVAERLRDVNRGYANYVRIRDAASRAGASDADQPFTPLQLAAAVRKNDMSVGKGDTARGQALMQDLSMAGKERLASRVPNSGSTDRALMAMLMSGGAYAVDPAAFAGLLTAAGAYTRPGQAFMRGLLTSRPGPIWGPLSDAARTIGPAAGATAQE